MDEIDVPSFFICPISLQIMKDPVTLSTGITYDRQSIEKWLFSAKNDTCPVTKQRLAADSDLTPNHTVRRLIQSWCTINASQGIERIPTPKPPITKFQISKLINDSKSSNLLQMKCLKTLRSIVTESDSNKRTVEAAGAVEYLASIINSNTSPIARDVDDEIESTNEALTILYHLQLSESGFKYLLCKNAEFLESLTRVLQLGSYESRAYAVMLLKSMFEVADPMQVTTLKPQFFVEVIQLLRDQISHQATKAALKLLIQICPWGRNRIKAVEAEAVTILIELLLDVTEKRSCEMMLMVLDILCGCAEGRWELIQHGAGLAVVSRKILRVSQAASEKAVRILLWISKFCGTASVVQELLQIGAVNKLCLVLHVDGNNKTKEKAKEILKLHARSWKNSPCMSPNLLASYPS